MVILYNVVGTGQKRAEKKVGKLEKCPELSTRGASIAYRKCVLTGLDIHIVSGPNRVHWARLGNIKIVEDISSAHTGK